MKSRIIGILITIVILVVAGIVGIPAISSAQAMDVEEGDLIRAIGDFDVWIVKYVGAKKFRRLILNPDVFNMYGHLRWGDVKDVDQSIVDGFTESTLVRAEGDPKVYKLYPAGDTGEKRWIETANIFNTWGFDWDAVYTINDFDRDSYVTGGPFEWFQTGNIQSITQLEPKQSNELEDNRIGVWAHCFWNPEGQGVFPNGILDASYILELGSKRVRLAIKSADAPDPDLLIDIARDEPEFSIDPSHDDFITRLAENGVIITYVLSFWDADYVAQGGEVQYPRFKIEGEIQRYLDFVQFIVHHFKDRVQYYEIWNEPDLRDRIQWIEVEDYINLVKRAASVIHQEYPDAKIVVGSTSSLDDPPSQEYLFTILESDIMPLVDVVEWHPMYGCSPECDWLRQYYYEYPSIVQEIKDVASTHGFIGEYVADEIHWCTLDQPEPPWPTYSETKSAKYYARGIVMHLGMDVTVTTIPLRDKPQVFHTNQNLCTIMAGNKPIELPIEIQSDATNIRSYSFSLTNGDNLIALWTDGVAVDNDTGVNANITLQDISTQEVIAIDVLNGYQQSIITGNINGNLTIQNLIVRDYPLILHIK